jgi:translation initiation factor IF-2
LKKATPSVRLNKNVEAKLPPKPPERTIRIASRATEAEKEALLDRQRRKQLGEVVETAQEAKQATAEPVKVEPVVEVKVEVPPAPVVTEAAAAAQTTAKGPEVKPATTQANPPLRFSGPPQNPVQNTNLPHRQPAQAAPLDNRGRPLTPDQIIAQQYRDRQNQANAPAAAPVNKDAAPEKLVEKFAERPALGGSKSRDISPSALLKKPPARPGAGGPGGGGGGHNRPGSHNRSSFRPRGGGGRGGRRPQHKHEVVEVSKVLELPEIISLSDLATRIRIPASELIKYFIKEGQMVTINQALSYEQAFTIATNYGFEVSESGSEMPDLDLLDDEKTEDLVNRPPVVTVLGHVDHGKTSLLDSIRKANVTAGEAGGITQRIGAYTVKFKDHPITFIDTPGHEAFTAMRARGAQVTDIAILVVAADDGIMPQTIEAINHAKAAKVPIIVAVNKIDKPNANPERVLQQLTEHNLVPEAWGGDTITANVSAHTKEGIDDLLDMILLVAEMQTIKANPNRPATGIIIEAGLDKGLGPVATVLVQTGTLKVGDIVVVGDAWGRVRILHNEDGQKIRSAGPSFPAEIIGLSDIPDAGDTLQVVEDEKMAKQVAEARTQRSRHSRIATNGGRTTLEDFFAQTQGQEVKELKILVKAEGQGSLEALLSSLEKLTTDEVKLSVVHAAVGAIRESDMMLASASKAFIVGFNVRPDSAVKRLADQEGVDIRLYKVIYHMLDEISKAMAGLLAPDVSEVELGRVEVRQVFKITKVGKVAGCYVTEGKITRDAELRVVREGVLVYEGKLESLKRFKDDVKEVTEGYECGLSVINYPDLQEGDILEAYRKEVTHRESL